MKFLGLASRKEVIDFYIRTDAAKKSTPSLPDWLNLEDANAVDDWFGKNDYKPGAISAFRSWAKVRLSWSDFLEIAVVNGIFVSSRVLGKLIGTSELKDWKPKKENMQTWHDSLSGGIFKDDFTIILRPATLGEKNEGAKFYVEDGSGRSICYFRAIAATNKPSEMNAYVGFDPDQNSQFLKNNLGWGFIGASAAQYSSFGDVVKTTGVTLEN
jgi:hypothetical protein